MKKKAQAPYPQGAFDYDPSPNDLLPKPPKPDEIEDYWGIQDAGDRTVSRMKREDLVTFVEHFCDGSKVFTSVNIRENDRERLLPVIFMPVALGAFHKWEEEDLKQIGLLYEYWEKAGPRSINGYPMFTSMHIMHIEDWEKARKAIVNEQLRRKERAKGIADDL